jgi:hypothetical protein
MTRKLIIQQNLQHKKPLIQYKQLQQLTTEKAHKISPLRHPTGYSQKSSTFSFSRISNSINVTHKKAL